MKMLVNAGFSALLLIIVAAQVGCAGTGTHQLGTTAPADTILLWDDPAATDTIIVEEFEDWDDGESTTEQLLLMRAYELRQEGEALHGAGDYWRAEQAYAEALELMQDVFGGAHLEVAISLFNLAHILEHLQRFAGMLQLLERGLTIMEAQFGSDHTLTAAALTRVAHAHLRLQDPHAARPFLARAVEIYEREDARTELATALTLSATMQEMAGDHAGADRLRERAAALRGQ